MIRREFKYKNWLVRYTPRDGGRLDQMRFDGFDLLTTKPVDFKPPENDYGEYEKRPVYGYDDCFPSVGKCPYPGLQWAVPDHGEVCWLPWDVAEQSNGLFFSVRSQVLPCLLKRELHFSKNAVSWVFEVHNEGKEVLPFQHVMHPLMPIRDIADIQLPAFATVFDNINRHTLNFKTPGALRTYLLERPIGTANMLFLQAIQTDRFSLKFKNGLTMEIIFPHRLFPTLGIWWNNCGYPNEENIQRSECAFEPVPGSNSSLEDAHKEASCFFLPPGEKMNWKIDWKMIR